MTPRIRHFSSPKTWHQLEDKRIFMGEVVEETYGYQMSVGFAQLAKGESADIPAPYDEVWIVTNGALAIRADGDTLLARAGDLLYVPAGSPGLAHAEEDVELVLASHPPSWTFGERDWEEARARPRQGAAARWFSPTKVETWEQVNDQGVFLGYAADEAQGAQFGMGFGRVRGDVAMDFTFPYDEIVVAVKGDFTVHADGEELSAGVGELVYMPSGVAGTFQAAKGAELAFAHYPTWERATREWSSRTPLKTGNSRPVPEERVRKGGREGLPGATPPGVSSPAAPVPPLGRNPTRSHP